MGTIHDLLKNTPLPKMIPIRQKFQRPRIADVSGVLRQELKKTNIENTIRPGMRIAITAGSRGIDHISDITKGIVCYCKEKGAYPFIVAAMGSHGGANEAGQREVLEGYGITEENMGCPISAKMDVREIGRLKSGAAVKIDKAASEADGIILVNRIKAHTSFRGEYESGLIKMMAIGLGKQSGAEACHHRGLYHMAESVKEYGLAIHKSANILFGVAILENAYEETAEIHALDYDEIPEKEPELLARSKDLLARFYFDSADVLVVDEIGKNISGDGMDPNITGRYTVNNIHTGLCPQRVVVLDIAAKSHNNGNGLGLADITTIRAFEKFDREKSYPNVLTSTALINCQIPMMFDTDKEALQAAVMTCTGIDRDRVRMIRVKNTLLMEELYISESLLAEAEKCPRIEVMGEARPWKFNQKDNLF